MHNLRLILFCSGSGVKILPFFKNFASEKKKEKEREELWKKLEDLELKRGLRRDGIIPT